MSARVSEKRPAGAGPLTYRDAGVDIDGGNALVERIKPAVRATHTAGVLGGLGGFGGLFELPTGAYRNPVLVSGTDGVGTKLLLAQAHARHGAVGIDLVAMCANDVVVQGARPLFFLDYYATGHLEPDVAAAVIEGIAAGCREVGAALIGGETAEMPGLYAPGEYDLAGFCVGVVEREKLITGAAVAPGDRVVALASSGPHANGFSLIRRIVERAGDPAAEQIDGVPLLDALLAPTRLYVKPLLALIEHLPVHALAHITGGGIVENLPRVLPPGCEARLDARTWRRPAVFDWLQRHGEVADDEMWRTFNCGVGMLVVLPAAHVAGALDLLASHRQEAWEIGAIAAREGAAAVRIDR